MTLLEIWHLVDISKNQSKEVIWGIALKDIITACTTFLVFILGFFLNNFYQKYREKERLKNVMNFIYEWIKKSINSIEKQIEHIELCKLIS
jgi:F0F1-type ATP synthase membrane subunit a